LKQYSGLQKKDVNTFLLCRCFVTDHIETLHENQHRCPGKSLKAGVQTVRTDTGVERSPQVYDCVEDLTLSLLSSDDANVCTDLWPQQTGRAKTRYLPPGNKDFHLSRGSVVIFQFLEPEKNLFFIYKECLRNTNVRKKESQRSRNNPSKHNMDHIKKLIRKDYFCTQCGIRTTRFGRSSCVHNGSDSRTFERVRYRYGRSHFYSWRSGTFHGGKQLRQSGGYTERIYLLSAFVQPGKTQSRGKHRYRKQQNKRLPVDITDGNGRLIAEIDGHMLRQRISKAIRRNFLFSFYQSGSYHFHFSSLLYPNGFMKLKEYRYCSCRPKASRDSPTAYWLKKGVSPF